MWRRTWAVAGRRPPTCGRRWRRIVAFILRKVMLTSTSNPS